MQNEIDIIVDLTLEEELENKLSNARWDELLNSLKVKELLYA